MARLTHSDLEKVLGVARSVSEARSGDDFSRVAVTELAVLVPSDALALNEVDPSTGRISYIAEPESYAAPPELDARLMELADAHPPHALLRNERGRVLSDPPFELTPGALTALYWHFGRPMDASTCPRPR
jgi:hypothetical protein